MRRRMIILAIVAGVLIFLAIATMLTRAFNVGDAENAAITNLVQAEARGDTGEVVERPDHGIGVRLAFRAFSGDLVAAEQVLGARVLVAVEHDELARRVGRRLAAVGELED